jgi:hypothetical protein
MRELQRRYKVRLVQIVYDGIPFDNYLPTGRFNRIQNRLIDAYDRGTYRPYGEIEMHGLANDNGGETPVEFSLANTDVEAALNNSHTLTTDVWLHMRNQKFPFELFDFDDWVSVELS